MWPNPQETAKHIERCFKILIVYVECFFAHFPQNITKRIQTAACFTNFVKETKYLTYSALTYLDCSNSSEIFQTSEFSPRNKKWLRFFTPSTYETYQSSYIFSWDTWTSSWVSNFDDVVVEIYLDHKFQWPQEGLNCESLAYDVLPNPA